jgi:hypothetical protein
MPPGRELAAKTRKDLEAQVERGAFALDAIKSYLAGEDLADQAASFLRGGAE